MHRRLPPLNALKAFEAAIDGEPLPEIDQNYLVREAEGGEMAANKPT